MKKSWQANEQTLVLTDASLSCCGVPRGQCTCDEKPKPKPQKQQSFLGAAVPFNQIFKEITSMIVSNTRHGVLEIRAPQNQIDQFVRDARRSGVSVTQNSQVPEEEMLGLPVWNYEDESESVQNCGCGGRSTANSSVPTDEMLNVPVWDY